MLQTESRDPILRLDQLIVRQDETIHLLKVQLKFVRILICELAVLLVIGIILAFMLLRS